MRAFPVFLCISLLLAGCAPMQAPATALPPTAEATADMQSLAEAQATAILEQARATALVMQAETQAAAILQDAGSTAPVPATPVPGENRPISTRPEGNTMDATAKAAAAAATEQAGSPIFEETPAPGDETRVEILNVAYAADGGMLIVNYKASPKIAGTFWPGGLSITDEATGTVYNEVPVMPIIGPLIGRPVEQGQPGYVMFVNTPPGLPRGSLVTVVLGNYSFEHIKVE
jgi:hypothetical protein